MTIWDTIADTKGPMRAAWDNDHDDTDRHVDIIDGELVWDYPGPVLDFGCGPGRLMIPLAQRHPDTRFVGFDTSQRMADPLFDQLSRNMTVVVADRIDPDDVPPASLAAAYSMLTFQHMDDNAMLTALDSITYAMQRGSRFVAQFVDGGPDDAGPLSYPRSRHDVDLLIGQWFSWHTYKSDPVEPSWFWLVGVR